VYDWKCETYVHQAWSMLATWEVVLALDIQLGGGGLL